MMTNMFWSNQFHKCDYSISRDHGSTWNSHSKPSHKPQQGSGRRITKGNELLASPVQEHFATSYSSLEHHLKSTHQVAILYKASYSISLRDLPSTRSPEFASSPLDPLDHSLHEYEVTLPIGTLSYLSDKHFVKIRKIFCFLLYRKSDYLM